MHASNITTTALSLICLSLGACVDGPDGLDGLDEVDEASFEDALDPDFEAPPSIEEAEEAEEVDEVSLVDVHDRELEAPPSIDEVEADLDATAQGFRSSGCEVFPLHQYFHAGLLDHMYTMDWVDMNRSAGANGYTWGGIEGFGCRNEVAGTVALYEYVRDSSSPSDRNHYYSTIDYGGSIPADGPDYVYEGIVGYVYQSGASNRHTLDQYYSHDINGSGQRDHFYTTNGNVYLDPAWGFEGPATQGFLNLDHGPQVVPIGHDYDRPLFFYARPFYFEMWYPATGKYTVYERCVDPDSPDFNVLYRHEVRDFVDGIALVKLRKGNDCHLRDVGVHAGEWFVRRVTYEAPVQFSY